MNTTRAPTTSVFHGWRILAVSMFVFVAGLAFPFFGAGVINEAMGRDLNLSRNTIGLGFSVMMLCAGLMSPLAAWAIARFGARRTQVFGLVVIAISGALLASSVERAWQYLGVFGALLGTGGAFGAIIPAQAVVAQWFSRRRALALSILWLAGGGGGAILAPLLGYIIRTSGDWRIGWWMMAATAVFAAVLVALIIRDTPAEVGQVPDGRIVENAGNASAYLNRTYKSDLDWTFAQALRTPTFWITTLGAIIYSMPLTLMFAYLVFHVHDLGHSTALAASALGMMGGGQVAGKLLVGVLGDRIEPRYLWAVAMLAMALGLALLAFANIAWMIPLAVALMGFGQGGSLVAAPTLLSNYYGTRAFPTLNGTITPIVTVCTAIGPIVVGFSRDQLGSYVLAFLLLAASLLAASVLMFMNRPPAAIQAEPTV